MTSADKGKERACTERTLTLTALPHAGGIAATPSPRAAVPPARSSSRRIRAPLMPRRARVTIRETPSPVTRRPGTWIGRYRVHPLDVISVVLGIAVLLAVFWLQ